MPAKSKEKVREEYIDHIRYLVEYWSELPFKTYKERCEGLAFSILVMLDGCSAGLPSVDLVLAPHPEDKQFHIDEGEDYYEPGMVFNDDVMLHDMFFVKK